MVQEKRYNKIKVSVAKDYDEMSQIAAEIILKKIESKTHINLLVPTGLTPSGVYAILREKPARLFRNVKFFNMDEYHDGKQLVSEDNPVSFRRVMNENLFNKIGAVKSFFPGVENIKKEGSYDEEIKRHGGIDLCLNAIGLDGHTFGFNFPKTSFESKTRKVKINEMTREVNKEKTGYETPKYAITTGIKTGMEAKEVLFLVSGERKADILSKVVYAIEPTTAIPATILMMHPKCKWIVDEEAASKL